jgi:hypothetical protein
VPSCIATGSITRNIGCTQIIVRRWMSGAGGCCLQVQEEQGDGCRRGGLSWGVVI